MKKKPNAIRRRYITPDQVATLRNSILNLFLLCTSAYRIGTPERKVAYRAMKPASRLLGGVV